MKIKKEFKRLPVSALRPYENNPRINDIAVADVIESMKQTGNIDPIEIDENGVILSGHTRLKALQAQGIKETDVLIVSGLTEAQKKKYRILANKAAEKALWDTAKLEVELEGLDFEGYDFGFDNFTEAEWFSREHHEGAEREAGNEEYNEFLEKFEAKKTTDDCYTPENVYEAVAEWVAKKYGIKRQTFIRPFYPGGDYQKENYAGKIVVDNPPFSILSEIEEWYNANNVKYFLFAPHVSNFPAKRRCCAVCVGAAITYENGARVNTSFVTNLENLAARTAPDPYRTITDADRENTKGRELPKYEYPPQVVTAAMLCFLSKYGEEFVLEHKETSDKIGYLDAQKGNDKGIYGGGFLISEQAAQRKMEAEKRIEENQVEWDQEIAEREREREEGAKARKIIWKLSERELEIIKNLG